MKDAFGKEINVGSFVTYAVVRNRTARLRFGVVTKVTGGKDERVSVKGYGKNFYHNEETTGDDYRWEEFNTTSCAWATSKLIVTDPKALPHDLRNLLEADRKTL